MGFHQVFFILFLPLGLPSSSKRWSALKVESYGLVGDVTHHFQAAPSYPKSHIGRGAKSKRGSTMYGVKEWH